jgi:hypothetical protein
VFRIGPIAHEIVAQALRAIALEDRVRSQDVNLYLRKALFPPHAEFSADAIGLRLPTREPTLHVFADLAPLLNWGHPARHLFFDARNGKLVFSAWSQFPIAEFRNSPDDFEPLHVPVVHLEPITRRVFLPQDETRRALKRTTGGRRFAILFAGSPSPCHVNDLEFLFRVLCDVYTFDPDDIFILNYDGRLPCVGGLPPYLQGDYTTAYRMGSRIVGAGTRDEFDRVFRIIAGKLKPADTLLIHTNNHGSDASTYLEPWLCGYPVTDLVYKASEFGERLASLPKCSSLIVAMQQCYGGGFLTPTISNSNATVTSFASAVPVNLGSIAIGPLDAWASSWIAAFKGSNADGSPLCHCHPVPADPSTRQAFDYSFAVHLPNDYPTYQDWPTGSGATQHLT